MAVQGGGNNGFSLVEATIADLAGALNNGSITAVELLAKYLRRINHYDSRGTCLNSIPILNPDCFKEAAASDARRAAGRSLGPLDGIPYTLKDSMMYKGMTCASGSPAFKNLIANKDSFVAAQLRQAGAVCIGRTQTPPMMASGMHRGVHGRAESPYSADYLTAAFSSGSSNGSGSSTAASFAAFGLGTETVSSGRSPASCNGLVAYTPSRAVISGRGIWPLYPTCDVLVPHTRTVEDMLAILNVLTVPDDEHEEFWEKQKFVEITPIDRPDSYESLVPGSTSIFRGKTVAAPAMYVGGHDPKAKATVVSPDSIELWQQAKADLEALGAKVIETDFPLVTNYEDDSVSGQNNNVEGFTPDWNSKERGELVAYNWDDFLRANNDPNIPTLAAVDGTQIFPRPTSDYPPDKYLEQKNFMNYPALVELARNRNGKSIWDVDGISTALPALEAQRKRDLEDWMDANGIDVVVFPAAGDVGRSDVDSNEESARHALQNGVKYSHGNRAIRHMGVPTVSVTMGLMPRIQMPLNLTFAGKHGQDSALLQYAYAFEQHRTRRQPPPRTPALPSDRVESAREAAVNKRPHLAERFLTNVTAKIQSQIGRPAHFVTVSGRGAPKGAEIVVHIDAQEGKKVLVDDADGSWSVEAEVTPFEVPVPLYGGMGEVMDKIMVVVVGTTPEKTTDGALILIDPKNATK